MAQKKNADKKAAEKSGGGGKEGLKERTGITTSFKDILHYYY